MGLIKPRQLEKVQVSVPTGSTLSLHSANQKAFQLHPHVPLAQPTTNSHLLYEFLKKLVLLSGAWKMNHCHLGVHRYKQNSYRSAMLVIAPVLILPLVQGCRGWEAVGGRKRRQLCLRWGVRALSVSPTQVQLKRVILSSQWHPRTPAMETGSEGNGGAEGPHPGIDCSGSSDKTTGKGRGELAGWGYCYPRKSSLIPEITCHTCGGQDLI